jgi:hypothetical protein
VQNYNQPPPGLCHQQHYTGEQLEEENGEVEEKIE